MTEIGTRIQLDAVRDAWGSTAFEAVLKADIEQLDAASLPLQQGLAHSSYACDEDIRLVVIHAAERSGTLQIVAGVFYNGIIAGCSCADDPSPSDTCQEYCEIQIDINMQTAATMISLLAS